MYYCIQYMYIKRSDNNLRECNLVIRRFLRSRHIKLLFYRHVTRVRYEMNENSALRGKK